MKGLKIFVSIAIFAIAGLYLFWCFGLSGVLNSETMVRKYEKIISDKLGFDVEIDGFEFGTKPNLTFSAKADEISSKNDEISILGIKYYSMPFSVKPSAIDAKKIYLNLENAKKLFLENNKKDNKFDISSLPVPLVNIDEVFIKLDENTSVQIRDIVSKKSGSKIVSNFIAKITTPYFENPIYAGKIGGIIYHKNIIFDNLKIENKNSELYLNNEMNNLHVTGKNLSVPELEATFLYFYKMKYPGKKNFIENFSSFKGLMDIDITYNHKTGFNGKCYTHNLGADFMGYKIPVYLPEVVFNFEGREISADAKGTFGGEPAITTVRMKGVGTKDFHTRGTVNSTLTNKFTQKYFQPIQISGSADASVIYDVKDSIVNIFYKLVVGKGSNLITKYGKLNLTNKSREIRAHTMKDGEKIYLKNYKYLITDNGKDYFELLSGEGLFERISGHYKPITASIKTHGNISVEVVRSFIEDYFDVGTFNADLKYNFLTKTLIGTLNLYDVRRSHFLFMKRVSAKSTGKNISYSSEGTFFGFPITFSFDADSNFKHGLIINNIDIHLKKFKIRRGHIDSVKAEINEKRSKYMSIRPGRKRTSDYPIEVKSGKIMVDEINHSKFDLYNVVLYGQLKDNVVDFTLPDTQYAKGTLSAVGKYNIENHSSDISFLAQNIDSNEVVTRFFNLPDHFEGLAYATLHLITKNKLNDIKAYATFGIHDGFLPKLGSREFVFRKTGKIKRILLGTKPIRFTLSKICNIDFSKPNVFYSNLRGSFYLDNNQVNDVKLYSESDNLSMFIEGNYNIISQVGHLVIWGKRNKIADRDIKIFKIPLGFIYKVLFRAEKFEDGYEDMIEQIPPIKAEPYETSTFRVNADGNLNSNDIKFKFKDIRGGAKTPAHQ